MPKDLFSAHASDYQKYRPTYPKQLFEFFASLVKDYELAWDCGTGNGQGAIGLVHYFNKVYATDLSAQQIDQAIPLSNIEYAVNPAESVALPDQSVSLITVFQAFHWFDQPAFFEEVKRVIKPNGVLAIINYHKLTIPNSAVNNISDWFRYDFLWENDCWAADIAQIYEGFSKVVFPWDDIEAPSFTSDFSWDRQDLINYFNTWSAVKTYEKKYGVNPVTEFVEPKLNDSWPKPSQKLDVKFSLGLRVGKIK